MVRGGIRLLISPLTGTIKSLNSGRRCDVYALVVRSTFLVAIIPRGVCTIQDPSFAFWRCVTGVLVWRLKFGAASSFPFRRFSSIQETSLYGHTLAACFCKNAPDAVGILSSASEGLVESFVMTVTKSAI